VAATRKKRSANSPGTKADGKHPDGPHLYLSRTGECISIKQLTAHDQFEAVNWSYLIRNRTRWAYDNANQTHELVGRATELMKDLLQASDDATDQQGLDVLTRLATAEMVEVSIPFTAEGEGWAYRILPWEYLLSAATQDKRAGQPLFVVRHLRRQAGVAVTSAKRFVHIESAPPTQRQYFDFDSERALTRITAGFIGASFDEDLDRLEDPTPGEIAASLRQKPALAIHVSGFDSWQAVAELGDHLSARFDSDGYLLPKDNRAGWSIVDAKDLCKLLVNPKAAPRLVTFNIYNSGPRLAALCVAEGAHAAVGYQDTFDPRLGEQFFSAFARACAVTDWDFAGSARYAWEHLKKSEQPLVGSGIILWLAQSIRDKRPASFKAIGAKVERQFDRKQSAKDISAGLEFEISPKDRINYSMLHNRGSFFNFFIMRRKPTLTGEVSDVKVFVRLQIGPDFYPFETRATLTVHQTAVDLATEIVVSLTSDLVRGVRDQMQTTLFIEVSYKDHVFYSRTHRMLLLPIDEWVDDDYGRPWLPSFVLPRDPAIRQIIDAAQKYLVALEDDAGAGFDGYQSVETSDGDAAEACESVDLQVRAIWSALMLDFPLAYINPPPTFTDKSQRIRTPSDTLAGRRGTCIDLAVLLAACLEYVDIHPVIVLLSGHAFPAYWRHSDYLERFMSGQDVRLPAKDEKLDPDYVSALLGQGGRWSLGKGHYKEIVQAIEDGKLVPLETVLLTSRTSFGDAVEEGRQNLMDVDDFDSLLDINRARTNPVRPITPLPIRREET
jgi:hypothetical protein